MATDTIAYVAVSLDGYIAGDDGAVDFLETYGSDEYDFHGFMAQIGGLVMGAATYEQIVGWGWPYGEVPGLVLTSRDLPIAEGAEIEFASGDTGDEIRAYAEKISGRVWVVGGGRVIVDAECRELSMSSRSTSCPWRSARGCRCSRTCSRGRSRLTSRERSPTAS